MEIDFTEVFMLCLCPIKVVQEFVLLKNAQNQMELILQ